MAPAILAFAFFGAAVSSPPQSGAAADLSVEKSGAVAVDSGDPADEAEPPTSADDAADADRMVFSDEQYSKLYEKHAVPEPEATPVEAPYIDPTESVIELEPYIVEGDGGLMLARFRRQWDLGRISIRKRVAEMNEELGEQIEFSGRANERFFSSRSLGGPRDRQEMFPVPAEEMESLTGAVIDAVDKALGKD